MGWLANGWTFERILESYPNITREDILAALAAEPHQAEGCMVVISTEYSPQAFPING